MPKNVQVTISADTNGFVSGVNKAIASTQKLGSAITSGVAKNEASISKLSNVAIGLGGAMLLGVGAAVRSAADFDQAMSNVSATGADARKNIAALRQEAIDLGASTSFSATEAANGIENLAKAGVSAKDTLGGGLKGSLDLAAAGGLSVADAAETAATALTQFGLQGKDVPHVADLLAQAAGTAQGEVSDMAAALKQSGSVANQFGLSLDETTQALSIFAKSGGVGSDAGTSFKTMLNQLYAPTGSAVKVLDQLGVSAYDSAGALRPIGGVLDELKGSLDQLPEADRNQALIKIFGTDGIRAANALLKEGSAGLRDAGNAFREYGSAADVAAAKQDNLKGDIEKLGGSFDSLLIKFGEGSQGGLRTFTQGLTAVIDKVGELPSGVQQGITAVAGIAGAALLGVGGLGKIAVAASETKTALNALGISAKAAGLAAGAIGGGLAIATGAIAYFATKSAESKARVDDFTAALQSQSDAIQENVGKVAGKQLQDAGAFTAARQLGLDLNTVTQAALGQTDAMGKVQQATEGALAVINTPQEYDSEAQKSIAAAQVLQDAVGQTGSEYNRAVQDAKDFGEATASTGSANQTAAAAAEKQTQSVEEQAAAFEAAIAQTYAYANALLAISGGQIGMEAAIDAGTAALEKNGKTLDIDSAKGRDNQIALDNLSAAVQKNVIEMTKGGVSADKIAAQNARGRASFIELATGMGKSGKEAEKLADRLFALPPDIKSQVVVSGAKVSEKQAKDLNTEIQKLPKEQRAKIVTIAETKGAKAAKAAIEQVKDKTVIARSKGDLKGAKDVKAAMAALRDRLVKAEARGDTKGAREVRGAMAALRGRVVVAKVEADTSGARLAQAAVNAVRGKLVTVTVNRVYTGRDNSGATGGLFTSEGFTMRGPLHRSNGGPVWGAGTATSDSIDAKLSNGEFVIRAKSVKAIGADRLDHMNRTGEMPGFRAGGFVGGLGFAAGGQVDIASLFRLITALQDPLRDIANATQSVAAASKALAAANKAAAPSKAVFDRANAAYTRAVNARDANRLANANQIKAARDRVARARTTKGKGDDRAAQANLSRVSRNNAAEQARLNARVTATGKTRNAAQDAYNSKLEVTKARTQALKDAQAELESQQKSLADSARQVSDGFSSTYRSTSTDARDWIDLMQQGTTDIVTFTANIKKLRASGLSETLVQQIIGMGAVAGSEIATQIAAGGGALVQQLNKANNALQTAADNLGYAGASGVTRLASGGYVRGAGSGTSDSIDAKLSNGEYVMTAAATKAIGVAALDRANYGRTVVEQPRQVRGYAGGGYVQAQQIDTAALRNALGGLRVSGELVMRDSKAYIEGITVGVMRNTGRQLARSA